MDSFLRKRLETSSKKDSPIFENIWEIFPLQSVLVKKPGELCINPARENKR
ncbi:hypothetical protein LEP1GSC169_1379 [Leptospira santarosai str. HAI1349]|nr:hypothetical protein LEP1GSC169_1379 [Leptospira santarosai str. HAI1349]